MPSRPATRLLVAALAGVLATAPLPRADAVGTRVAPTAVQSTSVTLPAGVTRLAGPTRYETAGAVASVFTAPVAAAFVATGRDFPDALSAAAAASALSAPLLLTQPTVLPPAVRSQLVRLSPGTIYVSGGPGAVAASVITALRRIAPVVRLSGADRYATNRAVVDAVFDAAPHAVLATGRDFPDALAAGAAAGADGLPLVLVDGARAALPAATVAALRRWGVRTVSVAGSHTAVSLGIERQLRSVGIEVHRHGGEDRYGTAVAVNAAFFGDGDVSALLLATGADFPDGLTGAALAGALQAPLYLTRRTCVPWDADAAITAFAPRATIVLGEEDVVAASAAAGRACSAPPPAMPAWSTRTWTWRTSVAAPFAGRPPVDVHDPTISLDASGLWIFRRPDTGARSDHPVDYAQYGISALLEYDRTGQRVWLDRALRHAERLTEIRTERDGAWWFPYEFPWTYYERTMTVPWWSGMAQGEALALFVRLAEKTGDARWDDAAAQTWRSFPQARSRVLPWSTLVADGHLWFETYAGNQPPLMVYNGHIFALFGVYDYWKRTRDPEAARYLDGATTTALESFPRIRVAGGVSYYCAQPGYCQVPRWQNRRYHPIVAGQLDTLARLTGDPAFSRAATTLRADWSP